MKDYFLTIITATFFLAILDGVLPNSKNGKVVKTIISIVSVTIILSPILKFFNYDYSAYQDEQIITDYNNYLNEYKIETTKNEIKALLINNGYEVKRVEIQNSDDKNLIEVFLIDNGINDQNEHIDSIEKAENLIEERLYLDLWEVQVVYANKEN